MADVFVSYDRRDRELAEKVVSTLTDQGLTVWWDDRITPHETWDKTIEREVDSARRVLVLWTNNSVQSDWVRTEAGAAKESTPPKLIQARFSDCKVPLAFRLLQHVDLIGWSPRKKHAGWDRLVGWLKDDNQAATPAPAAAAVAPPVAAPPVAAAPVVAAPVAAAVPPAAEPAAPQAPMGIASLAATDAVSAETPITPSEAVTGPEPAAGMGGAGVEPPPRTAAPALGGDNKKALIIGGAVIAGLLVIAVVLMLMPGGGGGGGSVGGGAANGVDRETQQVLAGYLDDYQQRFAAGAEEAGGDEFARINDDDGHDYQVRLQEGETYTILGACDVNCRDVDLFLTDSGGDQIVQDLALDDHPVLTVTPATTGSYTVRIGMANCQQDPCIGAARVMRGG